MRVDASSSTWLAEQQNALLASIFTARAIASSRGLAAYRANAHACAERALRTAYPVMVQLMGDENFAYLARDFWHQHPPLLGDLAQWGDKLPLFLTASDQLADTPYLADVACIEWALHTCAGAADRTQDAASFAALAQNEPAQLTLLTAPGTRILSSAFPAAAVVLAHKGEGSMADAAALLHAGVAQAAVVWRQGFVPRLRILLSAESAFTKSVCAGNTLAQALDAAHADFDFNGWLITNVQSGLVLGVAARALPTA
jgi:Putative DNA-binding domain